MEGPLPPIRRAQRNSQRLRGWLRPLPVWDGGATLASGTQMHFCEKCFVSAAAVLPRTRGRNNSKLCAAIVPIAPEALREEPSIEGCICVSVVIVLDARCGSG